jgi:hypothetical protein
MAVQLQDARLQRFDNAGERRIVGIDGQRDPGRALTGQLAKHTRHFQRDVPRRRWKEHEANHIGASIQRGAERLARGQATDFDSQRHGLA